MGDSKPIVPECMYSIICRIINIQVFVVVVQEEGSRKVLVYLNIPELRVKRSFPNFLKQVPVNGDTKTLNFLEQLV
jgi:hypothetical protein